MHYKKQNVNSVFCEKYCFFCKKRYNKYIAQTETDVKIKKVCHHMEKIYRNHKFVNYKYAKGETDIYGRMFHECYEIYLLLGGEVEFVNNHTRQTIKPFQVIIIPPGEYHQFIVTDDIDNYERCVLNIYPDFFQGDILKEALAEKELLLLDPSHRIVKSFIYLNECAVNISENDFPYILSAVATDVVFCIKNNRDARKLSEGGLRPLSLRVMHYIDAHYDKPLDLKLLSREFNFSVSSLCHIFKKDFGVSIKKYVTQKRLNASNLSLRNGENAEEVCAKYGFAGYSVFYRAYKKHFGMAPSKTAKRK